MTRRGIYVGILIRGDLEDLWKRTQEPLLHQRWDLRFSEIRYLPRDREGDPQRFLYATRIGAGLRVEGSGESVATREGENGARVSSLRFGSEDRKSLIREGSGYWRYEPCAEGVRFCTWYDYTTRFGALGKAVDALAFRPALGWATAWSFDRLRLWIERGIPPEVSASRAGVHAVARVALAFVVLWHGVVPKLWFAHPDELAMLRDAGVRAEAASELAGWGEVGFALLLILLWRARWPLWILVAGMIAATAGVSIFSPRFLSAPFNPVTLNLCVLALAAIALLSGSDLPSAARTSRSPEEPRT